MWQMIYCRAGDRQLFFSFFFTHRSGGTTDGTASYKPHCHCDIQSDTRLNSSHKNPGMKYDLEEVRDLVFPGNYSQVMAEQRERN